MEQLDVSSVDEALSYLILLVALALVPALLTWWLVAQRLNSRIRSKANGERWHLSRFGPLAPLVSAAALLCGFLAFFVPQIHDELSPDVRFAFLVLAGFALVGFLMSIVLWSYSNAPPRATHEAE